MSLPNLPYKGDQIPNQPFASPEVPATFDRLFGARVANEQLEPNPSFSGGNWVRPADWLPMPNIAPTEEKFAGLFPIFNLPANFLAVCFEGNYTVDWGDGIVENFESGIKAQHNYEWSEVDPGSLTSEGFRQVIVTVKPQEGEQLTRMSLDVVHDNVNSDKYPAVPWLDISVSLPNADSGKSITFTNSFDYTDLYSLQKLSLLNTGNATDFSQAFEYFYNLRSFELGTNKIENMSNMFNYCSSLTELSVSSMASVSDASNMFNSCVSLSSVTLSNLSSVENMEHMFDYCTSLKTVVLGEASKVTSMYAMFQSCYALSALALMDTSKVETMAYMFTGCSSLTSILIPDTSSVTDMYNMFGGCSSLTSLSLSDLTKVENTYNMVDWCPSLQVVSIPGVVTDIDLTSCLLSRTSIVSLFNDLGNSPSTIDVRHNYGASELTPEDVAIAVDKGWTVLH